MCHVPVNAVYLLLTAWSGLLGGVKSITTWQYSNRWRTLCPELSSLQSSYSEYSTLGPPCHWVTALTLVRPIFILTGWDFKALSLPLMREGFSGTQFVRFSQNLLTFPSNILHGSPQSLVLMTNGWRVPSPHCPGCPGALLATTHFTRNTKRKTTTGVRKLCN